MFFLDVFRYLLGYCADVSDIACRYTSKIRLLLNSYLSRFKLTLVEIQSLVGLLNFACSVLSQFCHTSFLYNSLYIRFSYESYIILICKPEYMIFISAVSYEFYIKRFI